MKLILHALHENSLPLINDGEHVPVYEVTTGQSLMVIVGALAVTIVASLLSPKGKAQHTASKIKHHALEYLEGDGDLTPADRDAIYASMVEEEAALRGMPERFREEYEDRELRELVGRVHEAHPVR